MDLNGVDIKALLAEILKSHPDLVARFRVTDSPASPTPSDMEEEDIEPPRRAKEPRSLASTGPSAPKIVPGPSAPVPRPAAVEEPHSETSPASSESDDFTTVATKSQKRKLKASKSLANPPKKMGLTAPTTSSRSPNSISQAEPEEESQDSPMAGPPKEKIPPLYIREKLSWQRILPILTDQGICFVSARSTAIGIRVDCPSSIEHRRLTTVLRQENVGYHTYALPDERVLRVVIRGLPKELNTEHIKADLVAQGLPVLEVHRMYHSRTKTPYEMVLVILELTPEGKRIFQTKSVCRLSGLRVETPNNRGRIGQCHRCQLYGHSARNCHAQPRCVKCLGNHGTADCARTQPTSEPPSCVLCRTQGHPANYRGCSKAPKEPRRRVKPTPRKPAASQPKETYVPAPVPTTNAWAKPLPRVSAPLPPKPTQAPAAPPAKPTPATVKLPTPSPQNSESDSADRAIVNFAVINRVLEAIDLDEMDTFVASLKIDAFAAIQVHMSLLVRIRNIQKSLNG